MVRGVRVPARFTHPIAVEEFAGLADYQAVVGGNIEAVDIRLLDITMYVNEEGLIRGLEYNPRATMLWWYHVPAARQKALLVGDAVIVGWHDDDGETTDIPDSLVAIFTSAESFRIEVQWKAGDEWEIISPPMPYIDYFDTLVWALILAEKAHPFELKVVSTVTSPTPLSDVDDVGGDPK